MHAKIIKGPIVIRYSLLYKKFKDVIKNPRKIPNIETITSISWMLFLSTFFAINMQQIKVATSIIATKSLIKDMLSPVYNYLSFLLSMRY